MKIGIVGNYGNNNQGDEAILEGILIQLEETYSIDRSDIIVFSTNPEQTHKKHGVQAVKLYHKKKSAPMTLINTVTKNKSIISKLDILFVGGGGILMDLYINGMVIFGMYGWLAKFSRIPVVIYGVGAGPISTRTGKVILRSLAHLAKLVTVRDQESKQLLHSIGVKAPIHVIADPAFQVKPPKETLPKNRNLQIGVTAVPFYHAGYWPEGDKTKYNDYINGMARNLDNLLQENTDANVNFFATKHPQDIAVTKDIKELMICKERCNIYDEALDHTEIVRLSSEQDIIIGTRLHSLILALVTKTPIIAVSYHHKVEDFMSLIKCDDLMVPIDKLNKRDDFFIDSYQELNKNWSATLNRFDIISREMKNNSKGMELVKNIYKG